MVFLIVLALILSTMAILAGSIVILLFVGDFLILSFGMFGTAIFLGLCIVPVVGLIMNAFWWDAKYKAAVQKRKNKKNT